MSVIHIIIKTHFKLILFTLKIEAFDIESVSESQSNFHHRLWFLVLMLAFGTLIFIFLLDFPLSIAIFAGNSSLTVLANQWLKCQLFTDATSKLLKLFQIIPTLLSLVCKRTQIIFINALMLFQLVECLFKLL